MANQEEGRESLQDEHQRHIDQSEEDPPPTLTVVMKEDEIVVEEEQCGSNQAEAEEVKPLKDSKLEEKINQFISLATSSLPELKQRTSTRRKISHYAPSDLTLELTTKVNEALFCHGRITSAGILDTFRRNVGMGITSASPVSELSNLVLQEIAKQDNSVEEAISIGDPRNNSVEEAISISDPRNEDDQRYTSISCLKSMQKLLNKKQIKMNRNGDDQRYTSISCLKSMQKLLNKKQIKWIFILLNVILELCQAVLSQEAGDGKMKGSRYRKLGAIVSSICLALSVLELLYEGKRHGVKWKRKRGGCYCFRYPTKQGRIFGRFALWFGLISAVLQFSLSIASLVLKRGAFKFDHLGLLLSLGYLLAALGGEHATMVAKVRCSSHGSNQAEGKLVEGIWELECPHCPPEHRA